MNVIIDIHTHVLPGLDDGPKTFQEADELLRLFRRQGVDKVICTPHYGHPQFGVTKQQIDEVFHAVLTRRPEDGLWPELIKGAEVRLSNLLQEDIRNMTVPTLGATRYVLVEFPSTEISYQAMELIHELIVRDYRPIMAHPERNLALQKDRALLNELIDAGILMQVTASCYTKPKNHSLSVQLAWFMLENKNVHFIASDAHDTQHRSPYPANVLRGSYLAPGTQQFVQW